MAQRILALDLGTSSVKLAEFEQSKGGELTLVNFGGQSLGVDPHDEENRPAYITAALREILAETRIKPGPVSLAVAGQSVFSRYIKLPPVAPEKVVQIVGFEAQQNVPFPMDEVVWDYQILPGGDDEQLDCLLVAIKREIISDVADAVADAGLEIDVVDVAPLAIFNAFRKNYPDAEGCSLVLDMGSRSTDLIFIEGDRIYNRSVPVAGNTITQQIARELDLDFLSADEVKKEHAFVSFGGAYEEPDNEVTRMVSKCVRSVMTRMHQEINRSINFYRGQQGGQPPSRILLTGGSSVIPELDTFFSEKLGLEVEYLQPFQHVSVGPALDQEVLAGELHVMAELVGLGLRKAGSCEIEINLLPPAVATEKQIKRQQPTYLAAMLAGVLALAAWVIHFALLGGVLTDQADVVERELNQLQAEKAQIDSVSSEVNRLKGDLEMLLSAKDRQDDWLVLLDDVRSALPDGAWVTSLEPQWPGKDELRRLEQTALQSPIRSDGTEEAEEPETPKISIVSLEGVGYLDYPAIERATAWPLFEKALQDSASFATNEVETVTPLPDSNQDFLQSFRFLPKLEQPIPYELEKIQAAD